MIWWWYGDDMVMIWWLYGDDMVMIWWWYGDDMVMIWWWYGDDMVMMVIMVMMVMLFGRSQRWAEGQWHSKFWCQLKRCNYTWSKLLTDSVRSVVSPLGVFSDQAQQNMLVCEDSRYSRPRKEWVPEHVHPFSHKQRARPTVVIDVRNEGQWHQCVESRWLFAVIFGYLEFLI